MTVARRMRDERTILRSPKILHLLSNPNLIHAEQCRRSFSHFIREFWSEADTAELVWNWHIDYLAEQLTKVAERVAAGLPKEYDLIINIPPGTTKSNADA